MLFPMKKAAKVKDNIHAKVRFYRCSRVFLQIKEWWNLVNLHLFYGGFFFRGPGDNSFWTVGEPQ
jgi:hypothetical protein